MYYCILLILSYVNLFFRNKLNVKQAIDYVAQSQSEVTSITIQNCWHKTDILYHTQESEIQEEMPITTEILDELPTNAQTLVQNLEEINVLDFLQCILNGNIFLVKDFVISKN